MDRKEVERRLYRYPQYKATMTEIRRQYAQKAHPEFGMAIQSGEVSDPTYGAVMQMERDPEYRRAREMVEVIEKVLARLDWTTRMVVEETYFRGQHRTMEGVAMRCGYSRMHCWRIRQQAIREFAQEMREPERADCKIMLQTTLQYIL